MKKWSYLKENDLIDIVAPSKGFPDLETARTSLKHAEELIKKLGFRAYSSQDLFKINDKDFCSNTAEYRCQDLKRALYSPESKAIWALKGGYGAMKIFPLLKGEKAPPLVKPIIGFSDTSLISNYVYSKWGFPSIHGALLGQYQIQKSEYKNFEEVKNLLTGEDEFVKYQIFPLNEIAEKTKFLEALFIGGNLTLFKCSLATDWQVDASEKIIFFEDLNEQGYQLDRIIEQLIQAKFFENIKAVIFGDIIPSLEEDGTNLCEVAIKNFASQAKFPVYYVEDIGHKKRNKPLPIGVKAEIFGENHQIYLRLESGGEEKKD